VQPACKGGGASGRRRRVAHGAALHRHSCPAPPPRRAPWRMTSRPRGRRRRHQRATAARPTTAHPAPASCTRRPSGRASGWVEWDGGRALRWPPAPARA
jgi:hypothetical protein